MIYLYIYIYIYIYTHSHTHTHISPLAFTVSDTVSVKPWNWNLISHDYYIRYDYSIKKRFLWNFNYISDTCSSDCDRENVYSNTREVKISLFKSMVLKMGSHDYNARNWKMSFPWNLKSKGLRYIYIYIYIYIYMSWVNTCMLTAKVIYMTFTVSIQMLTELYTIL